MSNEKANTKTLGMVPKDTKFRWNMNIKRQEYEDFYNIKYFNLFMAEWRIKADEETLPTRARYYRLRQFYTKGTVAVWNIKHTNSLGVAPYDVSDYDRYDFPIAGTLVNVHEISTEIIPAHKRSINDPKGFVIGYVQLNHRSVADVVKRYAKRLAEIDLVINTNLQVNKLPFIIETTDTDAARRKDIVQRILNNEVAVFANVSDVNAIKAISTAAPYIIDRLTQFKQSVENELKTYLGINNHASDVKRTYINAAETNSNDNEISGGADAFQQSLDRFSSEIKKYLGKTITFEKQESQEDIDPFAEDTTVKAKQYADEHKEDAQDGSVK